VTLIWTRSGRSLTDFEAPLDNNSSFHIRWNAQSHVTRRWTLSLETKSIGVDCYLNVHADLDTAKRAAVEHVVDHDRVPSPTPVRLI